MGESLTNLGFFGNKKSKIPKLDEKSRRSWGGKRNWGDNYSLNLNLNLNVNLNLIRSKFKLSFE